MSIVYYMNLKQMRRRYIDELYFFLLDKLIFIIIRYSFAFVSHNTEFSRFFETLIAKL